MIERSLVMASTEKKDVRMTKLLTTKHSQQSGSHIAKIQIWKVNNQADVTNRYRLGLETIFQGLLYVTSGHFTIRYSTSNAGFWKPDAPKSSDSQSRRIRRGDEPVSKLRRWLLRDAFNLRVGFKRTTPDMQGRKATQVKSSKSRHVCGLVHHTLTTSHERRRLLCLESRHEFDSKSIFPQTCMRELLCALETRHICSLETKSQPLHRHTSPRFVPHPSLTSSDIAEASSARQGNKHLSSRYLTSIRLARALWSCILSHSPPENANFPGLVVG